MNGAVARMHEYILAAGIVPDHVAQLVQLDEKVGHGFEYRPEFDPTIARF